MSTKHSEPNIIALMVLLTFTICNNNNQILDRINSITCHQVSPQRDPVMITLIDPLVNGYPKGGV